MARDGPGEDYILDRINQESGAYIMCPDNSSRQVHRLRVCFLVASYIGLILGYRFFSSGVPQTKLGLRVASC